jgi:hypothetical protein
VVQHRQALCSSKQIHDREESLHRGKKIYHIPYEKVRNVIFEEGLDIFVIKIEGMSFYVKNRYRYDKIIHYL